jgi:cytosine/adenosine deaminase-related metal-dependent hydrolase
MLLTMEDVFPYGNINPAMSLGMSDSIGSLAPGKQADIVLVDTLQDLNMLATTNVFADLLQMSHRGSVDTVLVAGRIVKRRGQLLGHNLPKLRRKVRTIQERLL